MIFRHLHNKIHFSTIELHFSDLIKINRHSTILYYSNSLFTRLFDKINNNWPPFNTKNSGLYMKRFRSFVLTERLNSLYNSTKLQYVNKNLAVLPCSPFTVKSANFFSCASMNSLYSSVISSSTIETGDGSSSNGWRWLVRTFADCLHSSKKGLQNVESLLRLIT